MSPKLATVEVAVGTDIDEWTGVIAGAGAGAGQGAESQSGRRGRPDAGRVSPSQAPLATLPSRRRDRVATWPCGARLESRAAREIACASAGADPKEIQR